MAMAAKETRLLQKLNLRRQNPQRPTPMARSIHQWPSRNGRNCWVNFSPPMDESTRRQGEELNQLSRLIFGRAACFWYTAVLIEFMAGIIGVAATVSRPRPTYELLLAISGFLLFATAYYLKISFRGLYDTAETMRRQSVLTEALGWPIGKTQFSQW